MKKRRENVDKRPLTPDYFNIFDRIAVRIHLGGKVDGKLVKETEVEQVEVRLAELGYTLPVSPTPKANYVPARRVGNLLFIAGQIPTADGEDKFVGKVGRDLPLEDGQAAARLCALNMLAQVRTALGGSFDSLVGCVKLGGFVNCEPEFGQQPQVINGASDLIVQVLGKSGKHARFAIGANSLPRNVAVEIDGIFEIRE
ncbi:MULTISPECIES: RidA family protein [unclassified Burkholderia]|uniref:RidA family protein n=1 Tax=unclassified Burkholderia TaxID=2613784 RepID=UPI002AB0F813|nr:MULTISPECIES: RidA family protein [unclassified Burkholderia]